MRPMRGGSLRPLFPGLQSSAAKLAIGLIVGSVIFALTRGGLGERLMLSPALTWSGDLWQPLTYVFVEGSPMGVIFGALVLWQMGGGLEQPWGSRRLLTFAIGVTVVAGLLTVLLAGVLPGSGVARSTYGGGWVMAGALWVAYGLSFGRAQTNFWGMPVSGNVLALIGVGFVFLEGAFSGWALIIPSAFGLALTWVAVRFGGPGEWWLRLGSWRLQRQVRSRSKRLRLVTRDRNTPRDSDRYLH